MPRLKPHRMKLMKRSGESVPAAHSPHRSHRETAIQHDSRSAPESSRRPVLSNRPAPGADKHSPNISAHHKSLTQPPTHDRYPGLVLQPDSSPISHDQLKAEVRGIYAGLVAVEAKCKSIDAAQGADPSSSLGPEQWQALIALHRTLLYEHHDFLMATQHPSSTKALRDLATKYSLPARMWKHGIHAFLELLRHRKPESQDYMLGFIYLAYQMMDLLFEAVPSYTDTWIECLGDLARYRVALEEERGVHALWGGVAARWYTLASERHLRLGRLYHHLGILERPSLRKFRLYAKSLTCTISFTNTRDSLATLCGPILQHDLSVSGSIGSAEARAVALHALMSPRTDTDFVDGVWSYTLDLLRENSKQLRDLGAYLAVVNIASLFETDSATNLMATQYAESINELIRLHQTSMATESRIFTLLTCGSITSNDFWAGTFDNIMSPYSWTPQELLPFLHVMLVYKHSLHSLRIRSLDECIENDLPWARMAELINTLVQAPITVEGEFDWTCRGSSWTLERAENSRLLSEDYLFRGLMWAQFYLGPRWFDVQNEDDVRAIETQNMRTARAQRVLQLVLAQNRPHTEDVKLDVHNRQFSAPTVEEWQQPPTPPSLNASSSHFMTGILWAFQSTALSCLLGPLSLLAKVSQLFPRALILLMMSSTAFAAPTGMVQSRNSTRTTPGLDVENLIAAPTGTAQSRNSANTTTRPGLENLITAPTGMAQSGNSTKTTPGTGFENLIGERVYQWMELFERFGFLFVVSIIVLATILNIVRLFLQKPKKLPKMSRDVAIMFSLLSWALIDLSPSSTHWILLTVLLWVCVETHYVGKMCWFTINGHLYFWTTLGSGLLASMFMAALQSDARPTLATMIQSGRGPTAFFVSCAARLLPNAVGMVPR